MTGQACEAWARRSSRAATSQSQSRATSLFEVGQVARVVDHVVGLLQALLPRDLRADAGLGVGALEAPLGHQTLEGDFGRAVDHDHRVQLHRVPVDRRQQGDGQHHDVVGALQRFTRLNHGDPDGRMRDGVELEACVLVGEGHGGERRPVDGAVGRDDPRAEAVDERLVGGAPGGHHIPRHLVGVDEDGAALDQQVGDGRLARTDAAREADGEHQAAAGCAGAEAPAAAGRRGRRATAKRTSVVSSGSSATNQSSAVMPVDPPLSSRATSL